MTKLPIFLNIKPFSSNGAWKGRKKKTDKYISFEKEVYYTLPKNVVIPEGKLKVYYEFGLSSKSGDGDNCIKQFQDVLALKYGFNDKRIYDWHVIKVDVKKGKEYIKFEIKKLLACG